MNSIIREIAAPKPTVAVRAARPRSITYSTLSVHRVKQILGAYGIDGPIEGAIFHRSMSDTYWLTSPQQQFALKLYTSNWRSREAIAQEIAAVRYAQSKGVSVAAPVPRRDGRYITHVKAPEGPRSAVLFEWAKGRTSKYSDANDARQFGRILAKLHDATNDFSGYSARPRLDVDYLFRHPANRIKAWLGDYSNLARRFDRLTHRIDQQLREAAIPDWGFCHGDVHVFNTRIDGDRLVLFDFDYFGEGWRITDLATYRWQARRNGAERSAWSAFLEGYMEIRPAIAESLRFTCLFMMMKHLWDKGRYITFAEQFDPISITEEFLEDAIIFCEELEQSQADVP